MMGETHCINIGLVFSVSKDSIQVVKIANREVKSNQR